LAAVITNDVAALDESFHAGAFPTECTTSAGLTKQDN
jgi:hypothetical protein